MLCYGVCLMERGRSHCVARGRSSAMFSYSCICSFVCVGDLGAQVMMETKVLSLGEDSPCGEE